MSKKIIGTVYRDTVTGNEWVERLPAKKFDKILWEISEGPEDSELVVCKCPRCKRDHRIKSTLEDTRNRMAESVHPWDKYCGYCGHMNILD